MAQKDVNILTKVLVSGKMKIRLQSVWLESYFFTYHILDFVALILKMGEIELF